MKKFLLGSKAINKDLGLLLLRLMAGGAMLDAHGWGKFSRVLDGDLGFANVFGMGETASLLLTVFAEAFCALLVALGLFTRFALVPLIITMLVAVFYIHADDPFSKQEMGLFYLVAYLTIFLSGPGKYSLDHLIKRA